VARYFRFHSREQLEAECRRLGLEIHFSDDLGPLFRPVALGSWRAGNSLCIQPMEGCDGTTDGRPDELTFRRYRRFGAGGAKLIWGEATAVVEEGRANPRQLLLGERTASHLARLVDSCRAAHREAWGTADDLVIGLQLTHSGRYSYRRPLPACQDPWLDRRTVADPVMSPDRDYSLVDDDYLRRLTDRFVAAARLAFHAGFQFVDIKQCHRYLLNELLAARNRPGPYGGTFENRTRLARDIITCIRDEVPALLVASRINVYDGIPHKRQANEPCSAQAPLPSPWGTHADDSSQPDLTEPLAWIGEMVRLGVSLINVTLGNPYASPHLQRPFDYPPPDAYEPPEHPLVGVDRHFRLTAQVQQSFPQLPVVGSGYSYLQEFLFQAGAANVRGGRTTFVGVGRAALPQPDFARQLLQQGHLDRRRVCRTFSYCTALMRAKHHALGQFPTGCPPFDKDVYGPIWAEAKQRPGEGQQP
jgi:2,4-dienoyl-CoA reductase-like NADH-dependent reductase (Old Yellow Enzyme family)